MVHGVVLLSLQTSTLPSVYAKTSALRASQQGRSSRTGRIAPSGESAPLVSPHHCGHWSDVQISDFWALTLWHAGCYHRPPLLSVGLSLIKCLSHCRSLCHAHCLSVCHSETLLALASARDPFLTLLSLTSHTLLSWILLRYSITLRPRSDSYAHSV